MTHNMDYPNSITFENIPKGLIFFLKENLFIVHVVVAKKNIKIIYISHKSIDSMEVKFR